jgi:glycine/D-amino acid oxidase-like deaminating enzyme
VSPSSADAVVIGGGIIGSSIAYYLAKAGLKRVVLLERNDICSGTSRSCQGGLQVQTKTAGPKLALARESFRLYDHLEEELGCDLEIQRDGGIIAAFNENEVKFLQSKACELSGQGVDVRCVDLAEAKSIEPNISEQVCAALWCPEDWTTNPIKVNFGFAHAAAALGVEIRTRTEVRGVTTSGRQVVGVDTAAGFLSAGLVVNAAGVWAPEIGRMVNLSIPVVPRRGQLLVTEPMPKMVRGVVLSANYLLSKKMPAQSEGGTNRVPGGAVFFQTASGNIMMGSTRELVGMDWRTTLEGIREVARHVTRVIPATAQARVIRAFAGLRPAAPDGMPILDHHPDLEGFIVAAGHEGDGIALAPITGYKIAAVVTGQIGWQDLAPFRLSRFAA